MIGSPLVTVVIPVYNAEKYLSETINAVIRQKLNFKQRIELVLVNDGSNDASERISVKYRNKYPRNIKLVHQENKGVSAARNNGLFHARGRYIHFLDSDDIPSRDFYTRSVRFLEKNSEKIDFVASKIMFFDGVYAPSYLHDNFKQSGVLSVDEQFDATIYHVSSVLIKRSAINKSLRFDERLIYSEDTKFLNQLLLKKKSYGILSRSTLYYRKRPDESSAINKKLTNKKYYLDTPTNVLYALMTDWTSHDGRVHSYMQHLVMNDIAWKLREEAHQNVLNAEEENKYKASIYKLIEKIDDEVIVNNKLTDIDQKKFLLKKKNKQVRFSQKDESFFYDKNILCDAASYVSQIGLTFDFIQKVSGSNFEYKIEAHSRYEPVDDGGFFQIQTGAGSFKLLGVRRTQLERSFLGDMFSGNVAYESIIKVNSVDTIEVFYVASSGRRFIVPVNTQQFTGLGEINGTYKVAGSIIFQKRTKTIKVLPNSIHRRIILELNFILKILFDLNLRRALSWIKKDIVNYRSMTRFMKKKKLAFEFAGPTAVVFRSFYSGIIDVGFRTIYFCGAYRSSRPIWLVSDRGSAAGDNGEALFSYIMSQKNLDVDVYFVISKKSSDYEKLKLVGAVVDIDSFKYKMLFLRANKIISSSADYYVYNAYGYRWPHFNDLYKFDFVFLQHGVTKDDMSGWLNKFEKNIKLFITAAKPEYESILKYDYYYGKDVVALTGFPRFDVLKNDPSNVLMLAPTWRHNILPESRHSNDGVRAYSTAFKNSEYYIFYNSLMNDDRVLRAMRATGMRGEFYVHPAFSRQFRDFISNEVFEIKKMPYSYKNAFSYSKLLVTDYSSVAFDFAYLSKPVIYTQFDKKKLYWDHIYEPGYFSYEKDGFGPVLYDYDSSVKIIVKMIEQKINITSYVDRTNQFFYEKDTENSKRVYEQIKNLKH